MRRFFALKTAAGATAFLNGSLGITRQTTAGASTSFIRDSDVTPISMRSSAGASFYYTTDARGSVLALTDSTQTKVASYTYDSWGVTTATGAQASPNPFQYAGGYKDAATGYTKFGAPYYDPGTVRFTQSAPSWQEANRYLYAEANPCNLTDPSGLSARWFFALLALVGTYVSFVSAAITTAVLAPTGIGGVLGSIGTDLGKREAGCNSHPASLFLG